MLLVSTAFAATPCADATRAPIALLLLWMLVGGVVLPARCCTVQQTQGKHHHLVQTPVQVLVQVLQLLGLSHWRQLCCSGTVALLVV